MRRGAAVTHSTPHVLTTARSHPLCSRPTMHCGLLHLLQSFPLKSLTLWAQKLPQRRSQPCVSYLAVNKDSISVPARRPAARTWTSQPSQQQASVSLLQSQKGTTASVGHPSTSPQRRRSTSMPRSVQWEQDLVLVGGESTESARSQGMRPLLIC